MEVLLAKGRTSISLVVLADSDVKKALERVHLAIQNSGCEPPHNKGITVNFAPAHLHKDSWRFDVPIALDVLVARGQIDAQATPGL